MSLWTVVLEKTLESPLDCKEIKPVSPKGNQPYIFIGRTDAETEAPILWPPDAKSWLNEKDPDAGKDRRQEAKGTTKDRYWVASPTQQTWVWAAAGYGDMVKERDAWHTAGVTKSWTQLTDFHHFILFFQQSCMGESWTIKKDECWRTDAFEMRH